MDASLYKNFHVLTNLGSPRVVLEGVQSFWIGGSGKWTVLQNSSQKTISTQERRTTNLKVSLRQ